ncbi:MAG: hypothetical protein ACKVTZ_08755 [Bacteroidia bacterium]
MKIARKREILLDLPNVRQWLGKVLSYKWAVMRKLGFTCVFGELAEAYILSNYKL